MNSGPVVFTAAGLRRGMRDSLPLLLALTPYGIVFGIVAHGTGLSLPEAVLMSGTVFGGSAQLVALGIWAHPAPVIGAAVAAFIVNLRSALMGPLLAPWFDRLRGWRLWLSLFLLVDNNWAMALKDMNSGGRDAAYFVGIGILLWVQWTVLTALGHAMGEVLRPPPGHPILFTALAVFVCMLASMWRGRPDAVPWLVAVAVAVATSWLLPGTFWHIIAGALAGSLAGAARDHARA